MPNDATIDESASRRLLTAIARSRCWVDDLLSGAAADFCEIAAREKLVERHVRFLIPLAYLSPRIVTAIAERRCPAHVTACYLARSLPLSWAEQDRRFALE